MQYVVFHAIIIAEGPEAHQVSVFAGGVDTSATVTKGTVLIYNAEQACLKEIHTKMLHKHLERLEKPFEGEDIMMEQSSRLDEEDSDQNANGIDYAKFCIWLFRYSQLMVITCIDAESPSLDPILNEEVQEEEAAEGSYSLQLLHDLKGA
ncbi:cactin [Forsythia ovata]|uniref:Cactin n=1 Tax=Forsythia ovata TaxID=205694 RepID=A0ABD1UCI0_9LAMI